MSNPPKEDGVTRTGHTREWKKIEASKTAMRTSNPIRAIVDQLKMPTNAEKPLISLSIGDPTVFGNLNVPENINSALCHNIKSRQFNGYFHSAGHPDARKAIAKAYTTEASPLNEEDVLITSGCSGALELALEVLLNEGDNVLVPRPGFSLYPTICDSKGYQWRSYNLLPEKNWECDLEHMRSLIDDKTQAILVNNPSNPCGSVYDKQHLEQIAALAAEYRLPIIADEIYADMCFKGITFYSLGEITAKYGVPVLVVGGLAKRYLVPGWRCGWIIIHDRQALFSQVRVGLLKLTTRILGANSLIQSVLGEALHKTPKDFYDEVMGKLEYNATYMRDRIKDIPGLVYVMPAGAMYAMIKVETEKFTDIQDDLEFSQKLLTEESVVVLPGKVFQIDNYFRVVICPPPEQLKIACNRIAAFCDRHLKKS